MGRHDVQHRLWPLILQSLLIALVSGFARPSAAQASNLSYFADAGCPDQAYFERLLRAKSTPLLTGTAADSSRIEVTLSRTETGFVGQLKLEQASHGGYEREVRGASCSEVANALAFVLALAIGAKDPLAVAPTAQASLAPPQLIRVSTERSTPVWHWGGGAQLGVRGGLAPVLPVLESVFLVGQHPSAGPFELELRLGFEHAQPTSQVGKDASSDFGWWAGRVDACPVSLHVGRRLALLPCLGAHLGRISAHGRPVIGQPHDAARLWADAVATGRLQFSLLRELMLEAQGDLLLPMTRYRFSYNPDSNVYRVPKMAAAGFIGLTVLFP